MPDTHQSRRHHMQQEAPDEFVGIERHHPFGGAMTVIFPAKLDFAIINVKQAIVGNGDAMGIAPKIVEHLPGTAKGRLGVDHPFVLRCAGEVLGKRARIGQWRQVGVEPQRACIEGPLQLFEKQAPEQAREHTHRQEETGATGDPARAIRGQTAAWHHAVQMRVIQQVLAPRVQDRDTADFGTEVLRVGGNGAQGIKAGMKQDGVERTLVLKGDRRDFLRDGEDNMEIGNRKQLGLSGLQPLRPRQALALRAVPVPATVVGDALMAARIAPLDMATQRGGAAELNGAHDPMLQRIEHTGMILPVCCAVAVKNIRHFEPDGGHDQAQKCTGGRGGGKGSGGCGSRSNGLTVAHTVLVETFR